MGRHTRHRLTGSLLRAEPVAQPEAQLADGAERADAPPSAVELQIAHARRRVAQVALASEASVPTTLPDVPAQGAAAPDRPCGWTPSGRHRR